MTSRSNRVIGLLLLLLVAAAIIFFPQVVRMMNEMACRITSGGACPPPPSSPTPSPAPTATATEAPVTTLYIWGGYRYFQDAEILGILYDKYSIGVEGDYKKGTFAMCDEYDPAKQKVDCIFPGSKIGIEYCEEKRPGAILKSSVAAQDRFVLFTWQQYLPALQEAGLVYQKESSWYIKMKPLVDAMMDGKQWSDINANIPGYIRTEFTDPDASSTGLQWMALAGSYLVPGNESGGKILTVQDLNSNPDILPQLYNYWEAQGAQIDTTSRLFAHFVASGAGIPMIVAYESSFTDWYMPLPAEQKLLAANIVGIYPEYTVNVEHTLASLSPACNALLSPLTQDPEIQRLAWQNHGLHPQGYIPSEPPAGAPWVAVQVPLIPEPKMDVTDAIMTYIKAAPTGLATPTP